MQCSVLMVITYLKEFVVFFETLPKGSKIGPTFPCNRNLNESLRMNSFIYYSYYIVDN